MGLLGLTNLLARGTFRTRLVTMFTELYHQFRHTRAVTGTGSVAQTDDGGLIIFNSASAFNFTLDQLTADIGGASEASKVSFINKGAGAVTLIAGSGVTLTGEVTIPGAIGTEYPSALVVWETATAARIVTGNANRLSLETVSTAGGTITLDFANKIERMFIGSASFATSKTIAISNNTNALVLNMVLTITNVAGTVIFPTSFTMQAVDSRWTDGTHTFTPVGTGKHEFSAVFDGTDWNLKVSYPYS